VAQRMESILKRFRSSQPLLPDTVYTLTSERQLKCHLDFGLNLPDALPFL
jgi:hypothetical protein